MAFKVTPLDPPIILPMGDDGKMARQVATAADGRPVYEERRIRAGKHVPLTDANGNHIAKKHDTTGEVLYHKYRRERREWDQQFTLESDGQGNLYKQDYTAPTEEELRRADTERRAAEFRDRLAVVAAERGITADSFMTMLANQQASKAADEIDPDAPDLSEPEFPRKAAGVGMWELSDGNKIRGSKEAAAEAEAALHAGAY